MHISQSTSSARSKEGRSKRQNCFSPFALSPPRLTSLFFFSQKTGNLICKGQSGKQQNWHWIFSPDPGLLKIRRTLAGLSLWFCLHKYFSPNVACFFVCNSVRIGQNVLNEVSGESSMVADFAYYHLNNLSGKLNWSRRNSMQRSISWTKTTKADDKEYNNLKLVDLQLQSPKQQMVCCMTKPLYGYVYGCL